MRNEKGITLISLIVIIIIMLILASISVAMLTGNNGMIIKSMEASEHNIRGEDIERIRASYSAVKVKLLSKADGNRRHVVSAEELEIQIENDLTEGGDVEVEDNSPSVEQGTKQNEYIYDVTMPSTNVYRVSITFESDDNDQETFSCTLLTANV